MLDWTFSSAASVQVTVTAEDEAAARDLAVAALHGEKPDRVLGPRPYKGLGLILVHTAPASPPKPVAPPKPKAKKAR